MHIAHVQLIITSLIKASFLSWIVTKLISCTWFQSPMKSTIGRYHSLSELRITMWPLIDETQAAQTQTLLSTGWKMLSLDYRDVIDTWALVIILTDCSFAVSNQDISAWQFIMDGLIGVYCLVSLKGKQLAIRALRWPDAALRWKPV